MSGVTLFIFVIVPLLHIKVPVPEALSVADWFLQSVVSFPALIDGSGLMIKLVVL